MPNYFREEGETQVIGGGYGGGYGGGGFGGGSSWCIFIVFLIVAWLLFRNDRNECGGGNNYGGGYGMPYPIYPPYAPPYGGGNCCSPLDCKIPMAPDMSNCEVDKDIWKLDAHMERCCCEEKTAIHEEGAKTRQLIQDNYVQDLRDKLTAKDCEVQSLKTQQYTDSKFDALYGKLNCYDNDNDKQYNRLDNKLDALICNLDCNLPKRPPVYYKGSTVNTHDIDCHDYPQRRGYNDGCGCDKDCCGF